MGKVWQEQLHGSRFHQTQERSFLRAKQDITPPGPQSDNRSINERTTGSVLVSFDASSNLLASKLDDSPGTVWIWDLAAAELRAVLLFHAPVDFRWHPRIKELLLIRAHEDTHSCSPFLWDPLSLGPKVVPAHDHLPSEKGAGKVTATWLNWEKEIPALFLSDTHHYCILSASDAVEKPCEWATYSTSTSKGFANDTFCDDDSYGAESSSLLEDTFSFKQG